VKHRGLGSFFVALGCLAMGALAPTAACNGTGTTPMCDFPDGANNPEAGCGVLIEGSAPEGVPDVAEEPVPTPVPDAGQDATSPHLPDSGAADSSVVDASVLDAPADAPLADAADDSSG
jgi:hypothetical protein